jgi:hypothetical protein
MQRKHHFHSDEEISVYDPSFYTYKSADDDSAPQHTSKKRKVPKKSVRFSNLLVVHHLPRPTDEELTERWYRKNDMTQIKKEIKDTLIAYHKVGRVPTRLPKVYCLRGLEGLLTPLKAHTTRVIRRRNVRVLLNAQYHMYTKTGIVDPNVLSMISHANSRQKVKEAQQIGAKDARIWYEEYLDFV